MNEPTPRTPAIVIHPSVVGTAFRDPEYRLVEASGLAEALDLEVREAVDVPVRAISPAGFFGRGKIDDLGAQAAEHGAEVVVVDAAVTPVQQRNLEKAWNVKVLDRTGLILEIFARRARTKEGRLQVELARLAYERSRLVRTWTHLERQRGGQGFMGGPGETQIEADRRIIRDKIARLRRDLEEVRRTRGLHRAKRKKAPYPQITLVGYTNAGKSSLFNTLTKADVLAKDMPFATLDPTMRHLDLPGGVRAMFSDTVGFISDLPPDLVEAFKATLEEVAEADLLLHVRDIAHGDSDAQADDVDAILERLGAGEEHGQRVIEVWNKIDLLDPDEADALRIAAERGEVEEGRPCVALSARTGVGLDRLIQAIDAVINEGAAVYAIDLAADEGKARAWVHSHGEVLDERVGDDGAMHLVARLSALAAGRYARSFGPLIETDETRLAAQ